jgi:hypothetical protein
MKNKITLDKTQVFHIKEICKILIPEYKKVRVFKNGTVVFKHRNVTLKELRLSGLKKHETIDNLIDSLLPKRLCLFKYNNLQFLPEIIKDFVSVKMSERDTLGYIYNELLDLKFPELKESDDYKEEITIRPQELPTNAFEVFGEDCIELIEISRRKETKLRRIIDLYYFEIVIAFTLICFSFILLLT